MLNIIITKVVCGYVCMYVFVCAICVCMYLYGEFRSILKRIFNFIRKYSSYILLLVINGELNRESHPIDCTYGVTNVLP